MKLKNSDSYFAPSFIISTALLSFSLLQMSCATSAHQAQEPERGVASQQNVASSLSGTRLAITVDDLPLYDDEYPGVNHIEVAKKVLAALKSHHVPEVYGFINATWLKEDPRLGEVLNLWREAGYPIGNHTYSHLDLDKVSVVEFVKDIDRNESYLRKYAGASSWKYFRYPYLDESNDHKKKLEVMKHLYKKGYKIAEVTVDFEDWALSDALACSVKKHDEKGAEFVKKYYMETANTSLRYALQISQGLYHRPIPQILLLHIGTIEAQMLDKLLTDLQRQGVEFIPLSEALRDPVYTEHSLPREILPGSSNFLDQAMDFYHRQTEDLHVKDYKDPNDDPVITHLCSEK